MATITVSEIKSLGNKISAGSSSSSAAKTTTSLQYPSARAAANDSTSSTTLSTTDLYKNGLLFTAYDYSSRTTTDMTSFRQKVLTTLTSGLSNANSTLSNNNAVANILLPRSKTDVDEVTHRFNDVGSSVMTRGNGTVGGAISNVASTALFGMLDSITSGIMADHNEQIYTTARSMYAGANNRIKTYRWEFTPRTVQDLIELIKINKTFTYYSYGSVSNSTYAKQIKSDIDSAYNSLLATVKDDKSQNYTSIMSQVTSFLTNVIVVSNPTIWFIKNFGSTTSFDQQEDLFGPAQIQSIRFDKAPEGEFQGLAIAPNMSSTYVMEITMREILTLSRASLYSNGSST